MARRTTSQFPTFRALQLPATSLLVPVPRLDALKSVGSSVRRGESLYTAAVEAGSIPLSPANANIVEHTSCTVVPSHSCPAVRINLSGATPSDAVRTTDAPRSAVAKPDDLPGWIDHIRAAGISANRVACPNLIGQLQHLLTRPCDTIICSALDNERDVQLNAALASSYMAEIRAAMQLLTTVTAARKAWFVASQYDRSQANALRRQARWKKIGVRPVSVRNVYPQSDPTLLIHRLLKRRLRPGRLPTELGVLLLDAQAAVAIGQLIVDDRPMLDVPVVVCDIPGGRVHHLSVPVGTSIRQVLDALAMQAENVPLSAGDSLRRLECASDAVFAGGENVLHVGYTGAAVSPDACIRCGWCVDACPTHLHPAGVFEAAQHHDLSRAESFGVDACIECGICSYVCPSRLPLMQSIRSLRMRRVS